MSMNLSDRLRAARLAGQQPEPAHAAVEEEIGRAHV